MLESLFLSEAKPGGVPNPGVSLFFLGKVQIVSRTLSGLFLVGALNRPRKRKRQIGKIPGPSPSNSGTSLATKCSKPQIANLAGAKEDPKTQHWETVFLPLVLTRRGRSTGKNPAPVIVFPSPRNCYQYWC